MQKHFKKIFFIGTLLASSLFAGCAVVMSPMNGAIYTGVKWDGAVGDAQDSKSGTTCAQNILGVVAIGDASINTAKGNGGIDKVAYVDHESTSILSTYSEYCVTAYGE